jgi:hypothetical protein
MNYPVLLWCDFFLHTESLIHESLPPLPIDLCADAIPAGQNFYTQKILSASRSLYHSPLLLTIAHPHFTFASVTLAHLTLLIKQLCSPFQIKTDFAQVFILVKQPAVEGYKTKHISSKFKIFDLQFGAYIRNLQEQCICMASHFHHGLRIHVQAMRILTNLFIYDVLPRNSATKTNLREAHFRLYT